MSAAEKYTAAAYLVVFAVVLAWLVIVAAKLARLEREVSELVELASRADAEEDAETAPPVTVTRVG